MLLAKKMWLLPRLRLALLAPVLLLSWHTASAEEIAVDAVLDHAYGKLDAGKGCRSFDHKGVAFCMKVSRVDRLDTDTGPRAYVLLTGDDPEGGHPAQGLVGAWVIEQKNGAASVVASAPALPMGVNGVAPGDWELIQLAKSDYWAWHSTTSDMHQGYSGSFHTIIAPYGRVVREIASFVGRYSDADACADKACERSSTDIDSKLAVDRHDPNAKVFPLAVTVTGKVQGKKLAPKVWTVPFDVKTWKYLPPKDWPLADRDF